MSPHPQFRAAALLLLGVLAACSDALQPAVLSSAPSAAAAAAGRGIPTRAEEHPTGWTSMSDSELWQYITRMDTTMIVGLRAPGAARGVWRGELLLSRSEWTSAHRAVVAQPGVTLLEADSQRPALLIKVASPQALTAVRRLPIVDYLEPRHVEAVGSGLASGCGDGGNPWPGTTTVAGGDLVHPSFKEMGIELAWKRSSGAGAKVGLIDTGLSINQLELMELGSATDGFTSGQSGGRTIESASGYDASCSHGTRMAGVIAAPRNGRGAVGVAWKANLAEFHHANDVWGASYTVDGWMSATGVRWAVQKGANVISMAFQSTSNQSYLADEIRYWYAHTQILFVGATGTAFRIQQVVFPAEMSEVYAVTGSDYGNPTNSCSDCFYSNKVALSSYIYQATHGMQVGTVTDINGSSVATAVISGVAALIYSRYPGITRAGVIDRLNRSGHLYPSNNGRVGYGVVNAMKALGGLYRVLPSGEEDVIAPVGGSVTVPFTLVTYTGDSPGALQYYWNNGANTASTTYEFFGPPHGEMIEYHLNWSVTDPSDGNVISGVKKVRVWGCDPVSGSC